MKAGGCSQLYQSRLCSAPHTYPVFTRSDIDTFMPWLQHAKTTKTHVTSKDLNLRQNSVAQAQLAHPAYYCSTRTINRPTNLANPMSCIGVPMRPHGASHVDWVSHF